MAESFLIALREGFEASLVIAIVLAFVRRHAPHQARAVWHGTAAALLVAVAAGVVMHLSIEGLNGIARLRTFALICVLATGLLTWMIFWMRRHGRVVKGDLEGRAGAALAARSSLGLALVAFAAVAREELETVLFLLSASSASDGGDLLTGTLVGLAAATALGVGVYRGSSHVDMRKFFLATGALIILFAGGLLSRGVQLLQASGDLGSMNDAVYDLTPHRWLTVDSQVGRFLAGVLGWDPRPSVEQALLYLVFVVPVGIAYFRGSDPASTSGPHPLGCEIRAHPTS